MTTPLTEILDLVGPLDDSPGEHAPRERFRRHLTRTLTQVGQIRDYVDECLRTSGPQYNRALQDLVNHVGRFLGFEVTFGRYQGAAGHPGFDGHWKSPTGFHVVVEVKTTEVYSVKTNTLVGYVEELISEGAIPSWDTALGLYVIGRPDPGIRQLHESVAYQKRTDQLRIISVDSLLTLADMAEQFGVTHDDILAVLQPSGPTIDPIVGLMLKLVVELPEPADHEDQGQKPPSPPIGAEPQHWLTSTKAEDDTTAEDIIAILVGQHKVYAFGERTPGRRYMKPGDWICFYATQNGVIAHARIVSAPEKKAHPKIAHPDEYPWLVNLDRVQLYLDNPVVVDAALRSRLDAFQGKDPNKSWAWFVQATKPVTEHDFNTLTRQQPRA